MRRRDDGRRLWLPVLLLAIATAVAIGGWLAVRGGDVDRSADGVEPATRLTDADDAPLDLDDCQAAVGRPVEEASADPFESRPAELQGSPKVSFAVQFQDEVSPYRLMSAFLLPGEELEVEAVLTDRTSEFEAVAEAGELERLGPETWRWRSPDEPGIYCIKVRDMGAAAVEGNETICVNAVVMRPYAGEEAVEGYRIGSYETVPLNGDPAYERPRGLVEVTAENRDAWVSPHFQLKQFLCKQGGDYPQYLVLHTRLLLKLEQLLERVQERGIEADTFYVMSAYRTPHYNASIGNRTKYSRHAYGDAADVFVDHDRDGVIDDLDGDGRITRADAEWMYELFDSLHGETWYMPFVGGMGLYGANASHGPFVHTDTRGTRVRW